MSAPAARMPDGEYSSTVRLRSAWPWLVLALAMLFIVLGGVLFSHS